MVEEGILGSGKYLCEPRDVSSWMVDDEAEELNKRPHYEELTMPG